MKNMNGVKSWVTDYDRAFSQTEDLDVLYDFAKDSMDLTAENAVESEEMSELGAAKMTDLTTAQIAEMFAWVDEVSSNA